MTCFLADMLRTVVSVSGIVSELVMWQAEWNHIHDHEA